MTSINIVQVNHPRVDTTLVRFLAVIFITNSHLDLLYPDPRLGTGGAIGNALFFFLSGFGIVSSLSAAKVSFGFVDYIKRRLIKIYPSVWLVTGLFFLINESVRVDGLGAILSYFIWPTGYWFISAIVIFYIPFYFIGKFESRLIFAVALVLFIPFFYFYRYLDLSVFSLESGDFKWIGYFQIMLVGGLFSRFRFEYFTQRQMFLIVFGLILMFYMAKIFVFKTGFGDFQFLIHFLLLALVCSLFEILSNDDVVEYFRSKKIFSAVSLVGGASLEIYLVQVPLIPYLKSFDVVFPFNIVFAFLAVSLIGILIGYIAPRLFYYLFVKGLGVQL
ncbi:acyltransferase family protein [Ferribacterium limneticum]|uniref:acyltransferase family protein n=1 Tax=Ferribacterium limneticum TaxID=76259 RepID=UPI001CF84FDC|nr:acyltransferase family protein [Ferribacterium limneticum]UCV24659.1 acyltransferase family protein [Ferribacterium limneticum]